MIITQTPLRISFLGGGTDFPDYYEIFGGSVISMAIDKYVYCIVQERFDDLIFLSYSIKEIVEKVPQIKHELVREAMRLTGVKKGVEVAFLSDVPAAGTGLGSSSSVTVGVLNALGLYTNRAWDAAYLAKTACKIEINRLKKPIGVQDQYIAAYGGLRFITFRSGNNIAINQINLSDNRISDFCHNLLVFYTGITRKSETILDEQKHNIPQKTSILKNLSKLSRDGLKLLESADFTGFGQLLDTGWQFKKQMASGITSPEIDALYSSAKSAGALGGKITGAGGGGFLVLYVPQTKQTAVRKRLYKLREMPVNYSRDGSKVIFNYRK